MRPAERLSRNWKSRCANTLKPRTRAVAAVRPAFRWRLPAPLPWGAPLSPQMGALALLKLPLAFTQNALLSPDEFANSADQRGIRLRAEHLLELHRRRALVP